MYFSGQGKLFVAKRDVNGIPQAFRYLGNVSDFKPTFTTDVLEHKESSSGQRLPDLRQIKSKAASITAKLDEYTKENLALGLYGTAVTTAGASVTAEVLPSALVVGNYARLKYPEVSAVVVKDSAGSPATLTLGTHYEIASANHGTLKILNLAAFVQPFKVDYTYGAHDRVAMFLADPDELFVRFEGVNTADGNKPVLLELYRVLFDPLKELASISDDLGALDLSGSALYDATRVADTVLGQFGQFIHV